MQSPQASTIVWLLLETFLETFASKDYRFLALEQLEIIQTLLRHSSLIYSLEFFARKEDHKLWGCKIENEPSVEVQTRS